MDTALRTLDILYSSSDFISGEKIASILGVSRNSVWKAINTLKKKGYSILSSANGYLLMERSSFDAHSIREGLKREHDIYIYKKEGSSNTVAKNLCRQDAQEGTLVIVESQTQGRGRMGRSFLSDSENGLYMSVVLRPRISADKCVAITVAAAVAVAEAIEELSKKECLIKWVNDIFIGEKKCCGILTEASVDFESGGLQYAILGIGVNICPPLGGFDSSIEDIACGIFEDTCPSGFKSRLCSMIVNKFFDYYERLEDKDYIDIYRRKSNIIGKTVDVYVGNEIISGVAVDIDENANLIVKDEQGTVRSFNSGEARVRRAERNEER